MAQLTWLSPLGSLAFRSKRWKRKLLLRYNSLSSYLRPRSRRVKRPPVLHVGEKRGKLVMNNSFWQFLPHSQIRFMRWMMLELFWYGSLVEKKLFNHDNFPELRAERIEWKMLNTQLRVSIACYLWSMEFSENSEFWNFIMNSASLLNLGSFNCDLCRKHANGNVDSIHRNMRWERNDDDEFSADDTNLNSFDDVCTNSRRQKLIVEWGKLDILLKWEQVVASWMSRERW